MMLLHKKYTHSDTTYHSNMLTKEHAAKATQVKQASLALHIGADLDAGIRRQSRPNEDTVLVTRGVIPSSWLPAKPFVVLAVADGMGGQGHGQEASQLAAGSLVTSLSASLGRQSGQPADVLSILKTGVESANRAVYERNEQQETLMGTTMTALLISETTAYVAHVGDSRLYLYRESTGLRQITSDHSVVARLVELGDIAPDDIYTHPRRNLIYRSLGTKASVEVDVTTVQLAAADILLLCSDGLWEMVRNQQIASILTQPLADPADTAHALIEAALAGGGQDNVCAIVAQVGSEDV